MSFEVVARPGGGSRTINHAVLNALKDTLESGQAIRVKLDSGSNYINWQATVRAELRKEGLKLRSRHNKVTNQVTCWVERYDETDNDTVSPEEVGVSDHGEHGE